MLDDSVCSHVWLHPIKGNRTGVQKVGLEMEMHVYDSTTLAPIGLPDSKLDPQILLERIAQISPESRVEKDELTHVITMVSLKNGGNFSSEPGGQIEYSSAPAATLSELISDVHSGLEILEKASDGDVVFFSHGTNPIAKDDHPLLLPKERYQIMTRYFESAPAEIRGIDMMRHSATVQANIDIFGTEHWHDAVNLVFVLIPLTSAMFANSRYFKNKKSTHFSERQEIWEHMDPTRSGYPMAEPLLQNDPNMECVYAAWAKKAYVFLVEGLPLHEQPLYGELTFENWMKNGYRGIFPTVSSWETHLATLFPHLRLRDFLEIRHIDAQPFEHTFAPIAFFSALIKSESTRKKTWDLIASHAVDLKTIFKTKDHFSFMHNPLLDLACEILSEQKDFVSMNSILAYKKFLKEKENYWNASSALEFVQKHKTDTPASDFIRFLK